MKVPLVLVAGLMVTPVELVVEPTVTLLVRERVGALWTTVTSTVLEDVVWPSPAKVTTVLVEEDFDPPLEKEPGAVSAATVKSIVTGDNVCVMVELPVEVSVQVTTPDVNVQEELSLLGSE